MSITTIEYSTLDDAFKYFNENLFENKLPDVIITLNRKSRTFGYHHHEKFQGRDNKEKITEIALNPDGFIERSDKEILGTLVHEMVHHWQWTFGEPCRAGYHDKEWGRKMKELGLHPTSTGEIGGKETGQRMTHFIMDGGKFEIKCGAFLLKHALSVESIPSEKKDRQKKGKTRLKYTCPSCMMNVWAKKDANIACGDCMEKLIVEEDE